MAIFKKKKGDGPSSSTGPSGANSSGSGGAAAAAAAVGSPPGPQMSAAQFATMPGGGPAPRSGIPVSQSSSILHNSQPSSPPAPMQHQVHQQLSSSLPTTSSSPPAPTAPPAHSTVLYPWSQRKLDYLASELLAPESGVISQGPTSHPPFPRYGHSVNPTASLPSGDLYIFGGLVANQVKNDLYVVQCQTAKGSGGVLGVKMIETGGEVPGPRVGHASVGVGNVLIVWGGDTKSRPDERQDDNLYLLNLSSRDWTRVKTSGPAPEGRYGHAAAMVGSRFFIFGGQKDDGGFMNDLVWFDLQKLKQGTPKWTFIDYPNETVVPPRRTGHTAVTYGDCIYIFGGTDGQYHYNDTWCYDTNTQVWSELSCIGYIPVPREGHAATLVEDVMYVFGGRGVDGKDLEDLAAFKISTQRWFMFQNMGPAPSGRSGHAMATYQNKVYVLGGESYTSERADDPSFVHVLDTSKIKYPSDSARQSSSRKSSVPNLAAAAAPPSGIVGSPRESQFPQEKVQQSLPPAVQVHAPNTTPPMGPGEFRQAPSSAGEEPTARSVSPTSRSNGAGGATVPPSFGQAFEQQQGGSPTGPPKGKPIVIGQQQQQQQQQQLQQQQPNQSKIAKRAATSGATSPPPMRPPRPGDDLTLNDSSRRIDPASSTSPQERAMSPNEQQRLRTVSPSGSAPRPWNANTPPQQSIGQFGGVPPSINTQGPASPIRRGSEGEGSEAHRSPIGVDGSPPPQDAFYYGAKPTLGGAAATPNGRTASPLGASASEALKAKDAEIIALKAREKWMQTVLALAAKKGFVPPTVSEDASGGEGDAARSLGLEEVSPRLEDGGNAKVVAALVQLKQELAKAKSTMATQASTVDERVAAANRARTAALQEATYYRAKLAALESGSPADVSRVEKDRSRELEHKLTEALAAKSTLEHQVAKLQSDVQHHSDMRSSVEERHAAAVNRADAAENSYSRSLSDYAELQRRAQTHETAAQDHLAELTTLKSALAALQGEHNQLREVVDSNDSSISLHVRTIEETQLALAAAHARADDTHASWEQSQGELEALRGQVAQLRADLEAKSTEHTAAISRAAETDRLLKSTRDEHEATKALATGGLASLLAFHRDAKPREAPNDAHTERVRALEEESTSFKQLHETSRAQVDSALAELNEVRGREVALQAQVVQLRAEIASIRNLHATTQDEASLHKSVAADRDGEVREAVKAKEAAEVKVALLRNIMADHGLTMSDDELATRFPPLTGDETAEQLHRRVQDLESRLEQRTRAHSELEGQHETTRRELQEAEQRHRDVAEKHQATEAQLESMRSAPTSAPEDTERATRAESELAGLQERHQQLEQTHTRAIQYVKGTEKMLRRMKEELTRHKERNEELETEIGDRDVQKKELESLRTQLRDLTASSTHSAQETESLQQRLATAQAEYEHNFNQLRNDSEDKIADLETELTALEQALDKSRREVTDMQASTSTMRNGSASGGDIKRLEQELAAAIAKSDWFKRENDQLEKRCEAAESKIHILLDHMEGNGGQEYSPDPNEADQQWKNRDSISDAGSDYSNHGASTAAPTHR